MDVVLIEGLTDAGAVTEVTGVTGAGAGDFL